MCFSSLVPGAVLGHKIIKHGSRNDLVPKGTKPSLEPMTTRD